MLTFADQLTWKGFDRSKAEVCAFHSDDDQGFQPREGEGVYRFICRVLGPERKVLAVRAHSVWYNPHNDGGHFVYADPQQPGWVRRDEYEALVEGHTCAKWIQPGMSTCPHCGTAVSG